MARPIELIVPNGSERRLAIEVVFKYPVDERTLRKAMEEYTELLSTECTFKREDQNAWKTIIGNNNRLSITSYTTFGDNLKKKYHESQLIKLIYDKYVGNYSTSELRRAMVDFNTLKEVSQARLDLLKTKTINPSQTYPGQQQYQANPSKQFSQTVNISKSHQQPTISGHIAFGADQTLAYGGQKYYPETMYIQLQQHADIQQNDIADLQSKLKDKNKEIEELRSRLSSFASKQLTEGNPDFTDLSDKNRPTIIADKFHSMYDDEWTSALEALTHTQKGHLCLSEEEAINLLMDIIKTSFAFCTDYSRKQKQMVVYLWNQSLDNPFATAYSTETPASATPTVSSTPAVSSTISEAVVKEFQDRRKIFHNESTKNAIKNFKEEVMLKQPKFKGKMIPPVEKYVEKSVELLWLMSVQDPPMVIKWPEPNSKFDTDNYKEYLRKGKTVKMAVWPAVFLHEKGALMSKGFAMPM